MTDNLTKIISFIYQELGRYRKPINRETSLEKDLGVTGDDAVEFLLKYGKEFNVNLSNLDIRKYFMPEGDSILPAIIRLFTGKRAKKEKELTVGDLVKGIQTGYLDESVINN